MAKYFKFKTLEDIRSESERLGLSLRFAEDLAPLFRPVAIGPLTSGNALCVQPMEGCDGTLEGRPGELTLRRYRRFGAGGAKLIWFEAAAVVPEGRASPRQLLLSADNLPAIADCLSVCRRAHRETFGRDDDLICGLQLTHSGRYSYQQPLRGRDDSILDPRTRPGPLLSDDDLARLVDSYVFAARLAEQAGFQFVDVKQCHGYLLNELLGARSRPGKYGGSLDNRTRLARDIFAAIRAANPNLLLGTRINMYDGLPYHKDPQSGIGVPDSFAPPIVDGWGMTLDDPLIPDSAEPLQYIGELARLGVTLVNVTAGCGYVSPHLLRPAETPPPDGYETPEHPLVGVDRHFCLTAAVQQTFPNLAVVGSGYSFLQEFVINAAAANVGEVRCTFAGMGRMTLAQPDFVKQVMDNGRLDRKRVCRTFSYCTALMRSKDHPLGQYPAGCPPFDKEAYGEIWQEVLEKRKP